MIQQKASYCSMRVGIVQSHLERKPDIWTRPDQQITASPEKRCKILGTTISPKTSTEHWFLKKPRHTAEKNRNRFHISRRHQEHNLTCGNEAPPPLESRRSGSCTRGASSAHGLTLADQIWELKNGQAGEVKSRTGQEQQVAGFMPGSMLETNAWKSLGRCRGHERVAEEMRWPSSKYYRPPTPATTCITATTWRIQDLLLHIKEQSRKCRERKSESFCSHSWCRYSQCSHRFREI